VTFRQILSILWHRRFYMLVTVLLAFVVASAFLTTQAPSFSSSTTIRYSPVSTTAAKSGEIGLTPVDFSEQSILLPAVLADAAKRSGAASGAVLENAVKYAIAGNNNTSAGSSSTELVTITAIGHTASSAQARANGVVAAYNSYLQTQLAKALAAAQSQQSRYTSNAETYQAQVTANPNNSIAQSNLATALLNLGAVNSTLASLASAGPPVTIYVPAPPGASHGVGKSTALLVALAAGLIAGIGIALIRDQLDNRLRGEYEVENLTGVPSLGELSLDRRAARGKVHLPAAERKQTALKEGLRSLRLTLQVLLSAHHNLVVFTSVEPGDGKTFLSANLALIWARAGKKVILVDGDLRRPGLGDYYGGAGSAGLAELLTSASTPDGLRPGEIESYLQPTDFDGLLILPSGSDRTASADLLAGPALDVIFGSLRAMSDIILVDSPPSMALVDASQLASSADGVVVVASIGRTNRDNLRTTVQSLQSHGISVLGVIANRSRKRMPKSYEELLRVSGRRR
jgi:succinoglycan biosynthesis transport protein ExoP